jgi:hypothetical protein
MNGVVRVGVLNSQNQVVPQANATGNRVFAQTTANIVSAFLQRQVGNVPPRPRASRPLPATRRWR